MARVTSFAGIPIQVVDTERPIDPLALAKTLLHEIHGLLQTLNETGQAGIIDLRALPPLGEEGYQFLRAKLGCGEVSAQLQSFGHSEIQETSFPGVWWITHYNQDDDLYTEQIEVGFLPTLLASHPDDVLQGMARYSELLTELEK